MRITGIEIERYGVWQNYSQSLFPTGLNVFYGPNEAGKTTLLRFIRGVLYGFRGEELPGTRRVRKSGPQSGRLRIEHGHRPYEIRRASRGEDAGLLTITGVDSVDSASELLSEIVHGADERLFESVFAVGLPELQEFATLTEDEVARHLYGMTLGPQGQLLMELPRRIDQELDHLWPREGSRGAIPELFERGRDLSQQLQGLRPQRDRYRALIRQRVELEQKIASLRKKQTDLQTQLRGHQFLEKVHPTWQRVRDHRRELSAIPDLRSFPTDGLNRLDRLEADRDAALRARDELSKEIRDLAAQMKSCVGKDDIRRFAGSIRALCDQRSQWDDLRQRKIDLEQQAAHHDRELTAHLAAIGPKWTLARLEAMPDSPDAHARFVLTARDFQQCRLRTLRRQRRYRRMSAACRDRELAVQTELQHLGISGPSLQQPLESARQRVSQFTELGKLQVQAAELQQRSEAVGDQLERLHDRLGMPDWVWAILSFFVIAGAALFFAGLSAGVSTGWLVGAIYIVLALTAGGTTWALKLQFEREIQQQVAALREERADIDARRFEMESRIHELVHDHQLCLVMKGSKPGLSEGPASRRETLQIFPDVNDLDREARPSEGPGLDATDGILISRAAERLAQLELLQREYQRVQDTRKRLSLIRGRLQGYQRELAASRKTWCDTLKSLGYDEVVNVDAAFQQWQAVAAARELRRKSADARRELRGLLEDWDRFRQKVEDLGRRMRAEGVDYQQPFETLSRWEQDLHDWIVGRQEYRRLMKERKVRRAEADDFQRRYEQYQQQIAALLQQAQATDRDDLVRKLQLYQRRQQVELLFQQATRDLESLAHAEPNLALVEEDLVRYRPQENADAIRRITREAAEVDHQLQELFEQSGTVKQELKALSTDRGGCRVRFELQQTQERLHDAWENWYASAISAETVDVVSALFEQSHQPEMLNAALPFVERLTCGKYKRMWTQLGRKQLFVDDEFARPRPAEQLSGGTREQLFLAIRLAMVKAFAKQGIELPMVLDDVTVNFDNERSEAAVDTLMEFVADGQQVLVFTSHLHFAQMFQKRGIEPIWLPARDRRAEVVEERRAG
jgi:uncharacterized protein YhaN